MVGAGLIAGATVIVDEGKSIEEQPHNIMIKREIETRFLRETWFLLILTAVRHHRGRSSPGL
jgi:hypothetical protein